MIIVPDTREKKNEIPRDDLSPSGLAVPVDPLPVGDVDKPIIPKNPAIFPRIRIPGLGALIFGMRWFDAPPCSN
jgi:hypothetical protein